MRPALNVIVVNYGAGNIGSVVNALWRAGADPIVTADPDRVRRADRVVLPGVGAAGPAIVKLRELGLDEALEEVRRAGRPLLGICVGMQLMAEELLEFGRHKGLGWIRGTVELLDTGGDPMVRVPHIGWSHIQEVGGKSRMIGLSPKDRFFYFCHSYRLTGDEGVAVARVDHGVPFTCAIEFDSVFACQFHPEKSHVAGQRLLARFLNWNP
jgi:glutamine amidotransferase